MLGVISHPANFGCKYQAQSQCAVSITDVPTTYNGLNHGYTGKWSGRGNPSLSGLKAMPRLGRAGGLGLSIVLSIKACTTTCTKMQLLITEVIQGCQLMLELSDAPIACTIRYCQICSVTKDWDTKLNLPGRNWHNWNWASVAQADDFLRRAT